MSPFFSALILISRETHWTGNSTKNHFKVFNVRNGSRSHVPVHFSVNNGSIKMEKCKYFNVQLEHYLSNYISVITINYLGVKCLADLLNLFPI